MLALPSGFEACARETTHGDAAAPKQLPHLLLREGLIMAKRTRWTVFAVNHGELGSTEAVYDAIWEGLGTAGSRRLSVRREAGEYWALVYKADSAIVDLSSLSQVARPKAAYEIPKPGAGQAGSRAIVSFACAWFEAQETTSNMRVIEEPSIHCQQVHQEMRQLSETEFLYTIADARQGLVPDADTIKKCSPELKALRSQETKRQRAAEQQCQDPCYRAVQPDGLHMPTDFCEPETWVGKTWCPPCGCTEHEFPSLAQ